jgi:glutathione S-transferase
MVDFYELAGRDPEVRFSPFCWRVRMALAHKGVEVNDIPWHFGEKQLPNGLSAVPVLVEDGEVVADSTQIALHLEDRYQNGPSLFGGEGGEVHARFIVAWADTILQPAMLPVLALHILAQVRPEAASYYRQSREARLGMSLEQAAQASEKTVDHVRAVLAPVRRVVEHAEFLGGDEPSYADYAVFGAFQWARCVGGPELLTTEDPVHGWRERMLDLFDGLAREAKTAREVEQVG